MATKMGSAIKELATEKIIAFKKGLICSFICNKVITVTGKRVKSHGTKAGEKGTTLK
jgi:hypothetical protein